MFRACWVVFHVSYVTLIDQLLLITPFTHICFVVGLLPGIPSTLFQLVRFNSRKLTSTLSQSSYKINPDVFASFLTFSGVRLDYTFLFSTFLKTKEQTIRTPLIAENSSSGSVSRVGLLLSVPLPLVSFLVYARS